MGRGMRVQDETGTVFLTLHVPVSPLVSDSSTAMTLRDAVRPILLCALLAVVGAFDEPAADEGTVLVADKTDDVVFFVDAQTYAVEDTVAVGRGPHEVAAHPDLGRAYVANYEGEGTLSILDLDTRTEVERVDLSPYSRPHGITVHPDGKSVYVTVEANQSVIEVDAETGVVRRALKTNQEGTHMLALSADDKRLYTTNLGSGTASVLDLQDGAVVRHLQTGEGTEGIALTPDGEELWVSNRAEDLVSIIDTETLKTLDTIDVSGFPLRVYMTSDGTQALVSCARAGEVAVVDVERRTVIQRVATGHAPVGVQITPDDRRAFVGNMRGGTVTVLDLETPSVVRQIDLGSGPDGMAFVPAG